jgi:hypothetical protein
MGRGVWRVATPPYTAGVSTNRGGLFAACQRCLCAHQQLHLRHAHPPGVHLAGEGEGAGRAVGAAGRLARRAGRRVHGAAPPPPTHTHGHPPGPLPPCLLPPLTPPAAAGHEGHILSCKPTAVPCGVLLLLGAFTMESMPLCPSRAYGVHSGVWALWLLPWRGGAGMWEGSPCGSSYTALQRLPLPPYKQRRHLPYHKTWKYLS